MSGAGSEVVTDGTGGPVPPDPGWRPAVRSSARFLVPGAVRSLGSDSGVPHILTIRAIFLSFSVALVLFLAVILVILPPDQGAAEGGGPAWLLTLAGGVVAAGISLWLGRRSLPCAGRDELARAYVRRFFLRIAFGEMPALLGFVGAFLAETPWPYVAGLGLSAIAFAGVAPTADRLRRIDEELMRGGCPHSLRAAMYPPREATAGP